MAINTPQPPQGPVDQEPAHGVGFALHYPGHIAVAALALARRGRRDDRRSLWFQARHRQRLRPRRRERASDIAPWFEVPAAIVAMMAVRLPSAIYFVSWLGERTVADIRLAVHRNLLRLSPGFFEENRPAEITSRITVDTTIIEQVVGTTVSVALAQRWSWRIGCVVDHVRARAQACRTDAARDPGRARPDRLPRPARPCDLDPKPGPHCRRRHRHQRGAWRDEDRAGLQPAEARSARASATRSSASSRPPSGASLHPRVHDRDDHLPDVRRDRPGHLARRNRRRRRPDERRHDRGIRSLRRTSRRRVRRTCRKSMATCCAPPARRNGLSELLDAEPEIRAPAEPGSCRSPPSGAARVRACDLPLSDAARDVGARTIST